MRASGILKDQDWAKFLDEISWHGKTSLKKKNEHNNMCIAYL